MSKDDYNTIDINENITFVQLVSKYKIILDKQSTPIINRKKQKARIALIKEFNEECETSMTEAQLLTKLHNIKSRLKEKTFKNMSRSKQLPFQKWEQMFLDIWVGNRLTNSEDKSLELDVINETQETSPTDIVMKYEAGEYVMDRDPVTASESSTQTSFKDMEDNEYENLSLDELKRLALSAQIKMFKAQEAAARAKEKLKLYKLSYLLNNSIKKE